MKDADPESYTFEVEPNDPNKHLAEPGGHILRITSPTHGDEKNRSSSLFRFSEAELAALRDEIGEYLDAASELISFGPVSLRRCRECNQGNHGASCLRVKCQCRCWPDKTPGPDAPVRR
jgi:hypothetical protein